MTLAKEISQKLNIACIHKDSIKSFIYDVGFLTRRSIDLTFRFAEEQISNGIDIIVEAPFSH